MNFISTLLRLIMLAAHVSLVICANDNTADQLYYNSIDDDAPHESLVLCDNENINDQLDNSIDETAHISLTLCANDNMADQLYKSIDDLRYEEALNITIQLENENKTKIIIDVVNRLINNSHRNTMEFGYKLWDENRKEIVKQCFPNEFQALFDGSNVKLIDKRDNFAIKLGWDTDQDNDRRAYGDSEDKTSERVRWKMIPTWDFAYLQFQILNVKHDQYLKVEISVNDKNEHKVWGGKKFDNRRYQWALQPARYENDVLFYIYTRFAGQALKLDREVDSDGDRLVWTHDGKVDDRPELFGWYIEPF